MKPKILLPAVLGSLTMMIILWIYFATQPLRTEAVFEATVNSDCAPWDGMAYTITIPQPAGTGIIVSIWQSPDFQFPVTYSFPDSGGRVGTAVSQPTSGIVQQLNGTITLQPFSLGKPIEGRINFTSNAGRQYIGNFTAQWGTQRALCG
jgi:hypothetical protein